MPQLTVPDALLVIGTHCPHCPTVLAGFSDLIKQGLIGRLEIINLEQRPERVAELGVRGVPWMRIGPFELEGLRSPAELKKWAQQAGSETGLADYYTELLSEGQLAKVEASVRKNPAALAALLSLMDDPEAELQVRLGVSAVVEGLTGTPELQSALDKLAALSHSGDARTRNDACYFLGLTRDPRARPVLEERLEDDDAGVRETAAEALEALPD